MESDFFPIRSQIPPTFSGSSDWPNRDPHLAYYFLPTKNAYVAVVILGVYAHTFIDE